MFRFVATGLLLLACTGSVRAGDAGAEWSWVEFYQPRHDVVATAVGLSTGENRDESRREYRLWLEGVGDPDALLVLWETKDLVRGEMFWWWENESARWRRKIRRLVKREYSCGELQRAGTVEWCKQVFVTPPAWKDLLKALRTHDLETLPTQAPGLGAFDGHSLTVEILGRNTAVRYHYNNPDRFSHPDCEKAAAITREVWAMYRANASRGD